MIVAGDHMTQVHLYLMLVMEWHLTMKELVNNWNEKHPDYQLVHGTYSYIVDGQSKDMHMLTIFNKDNECVCEYKGEDFIKLYNTLEEEWEE